MLIKLIINKSLTIKITVIIYILFFNSFLYAQYYAIKENTNIDKIPLYNKPSVKQNIVGYIANHAKYLYIKKCINTKNKKWCLLSYPFTYKNLKKHNKKLYKKNFWIEEKYLIKQEKLKSFYSILKGYTFRVVKHKKGEYLNVRAGPNVKFPIINKLPYDMEGIEVISCVEPKIKLKMKQWRWCWIEFEDDLEYKSFGWVYAKYLDYDTDISFIFDNNKTTHFSKPFVEMNHANRPVVIYSDDKYIVTKFISLKVWSINNYKLLLTINNINKLKPPRPIELFQNRTPAFFKNKIKYDKYIITSRNNGLLVYNIENKSSYILPYKFTLYTGFKLSFFKKKIILTRGYHNDPIKIFNIENGKLLKEIKVSEYAHYGEDDDGDPGIVEAIDLWENDKIYKQNLYLTSDSSIKVFSLKTGKLIKIYKNLCGKLFAVNKDFIIADYCKRFYSKDNKIKIYDKNTATKVKEITRCDSPKYEVLTQIDLSDKFFFKTCNMDWYNISEYPKEYFSNGSIEVYNFKQNKKILKITNIVSSHSLVQPAKIKNNKLLYVLPKKRFISIEIDKKKIKKYINYNVIKSDIGKSCIKIYKEIRRKNKLTSKVLYYKFNKNGIYEVSKCNIERNPIYYTYAFYYQFNIDTERPKEFEIINLDNNNTIKYKAENGFYPIAFGKKCISYKSFNDKKTYYLRYNDNKIWKVNYCNWKDLYDNKYKIIRTHKNLIKIEDRRNNKTLVTFYTFKNNQWLTQTPEGYFTGTPEAAKHLNITKYTKDGMEPFDFSQLYDHFFRPDLVKLKLSGKEKEYQKAINGMTYQEALKNPPPKLSFISIDNKKIDKDNFKYKVVKTNKNRVKITFYVKEQDNGGVGNIRVYQEGKLIKTIGSAKINRKSANLDTTLEQNSLDKKTIALQKNNLNSNTIMGASIDTKDIVSKVKPTTNTINKEGNYSVEIDLKSGINTIDIEAFNKTNTVSSFRERIDIKANIPKQKPNLYILSVGISNFYNPQHLTDYPNLKYSKKDAIDIAKILSNKSKKLYNKINTITLLDSNATLSNIEKELNSIKEKATINDVVIFYISTHGVADKDNLYLATYNIKDGKFIEFNSLFEKIQAIKALNQIFIIDSCQSGKADDIISQVYDSRASVIAKNFGVHMLLATTRGAYAFANSNNKDKNSLFTSKILRALKSKKTDTNKDGYISIKELVKKLKQLSSDTDKQYPIIRSIGGDVRVVRVD